MDGYEVLTSDDAKVGKVVKASGDFVIVEHGTIFKSRHAIPRVFAHADDDERVVRTTISKTMIEDSPEVEDGNVDEQEVARYYGLAAGDPAPETLGAGELLPDDPARSAEADRAAAGLPTAGEERLTAQRHVHDGVSGPPSPGLLGSRNPENDR
jgi:hypothetical protein